MDGGLGDQLLVGASLGYAAASHSLRPIRILSLAPRYIAGNEEANDYETCFNGFCPGPLCCHMSDTWKTVKTVLYDASVIPKIRDDRGADKSRPASSSRALILGFSSPVARATGYTMSPLRGSIQPSRMTPNNSSSSSSSSSNVAGDRSRTTTRTKSYLKPYRRPDGLSR